MTAGWDDIIVGAGSSGAVLAAKLSEDLGRRILLLEAGPDYPVADAPAEMRRGHWTGIVDRARFPQFQWLGLTARRCRGRSEEPLWRGRGVGGSSAINGQVAIRPPLEDFDAWAAAGASTWSGEMALRGFIALERDLQFGDAAYHGAGGPIPIDRAPRAEWGDLDQAFCDAFSRAGLGWWDDSNAPGAAGLSPFPYNAADGVRVGTNEAYLEPARARPNLTIIGEALVDQVRFDGGRATGVTAWIGGALRSFLGDRVILSAGAIHSPAILMRSGVGPADHLRSLGVPVVADLPVGERLQDHPHVFFGFSVPATIRLPANGRHTNLCARWTSDIGDNDMMAVVNGPAPSNPTSAGVGVAVNQAYSTGTVRLSSANAWDDPAVDMNLCDDARDRTRLRAAVPFMRDLFESAELRALIDGPVRGHDGTDLAELRSDAAIDAWIDHTVDGSAHPASTCPMDGGGRGVVDGDARVIGTEGLHIVDLSITPTSPRANTNLTAIMIGEHFGGRLARA